MYPRAGGGPPGQYFRVLPAGDLGLRLVAAVSFPLPLVRARRWSIAFGFGRVRWFRLFLRLAPRVGVGFGRLRPPRRWFRLSF